nr:sulfotransferase [Micromonospora sp. DSM 115978]
MTAASGSGRAGAASGSDRVGGGRAGGLRVLYLAGSGRSGSTLVTTILGQLDGFVGAGELRYLWQRGLVENRPCGCGRPVRDCPLWGAVLRDLPGAETAGGEAAGDAGAETDPAGIDAAGNDAGIGAAGIAGRLRMRLRMRGLPAMLRRHRAGRPPVGRHPDDAVIGALYAALARHVPTLAAGGPVIVDSSKLPPYGALLSSLPGLDVRVLHLVRDPRATAYSWRRRRRLDGPADDRLMSRPPVWKAALLWLVWNAATARLWGAAGSDRYLRIRYEDLVADPAAVLRRIVTFAGAGGVHLPVTPDGLVRLAPTHSVAGNPSRHRVGVVPISADAEWTRSLPGRSYAVVTAVTLPLLRRFGYPLRRAAAPEVRAVPAVSVRRGEG